MKLRMLTAFILTAVAGVAMHFVYDLCPVPLVGLLMPMNESVWEHLKMLYWPFLVAMFCLLRGKHDSRTGWGAAMTALLAMPLLLIGAHYALTAGFALGAHEVGFALYLPVLAAGFFLFAKLKKCAGLEKMAGIGVILAGVYGASLIFFSIAPPELPIFTEIL